MTIFAGADSGEDGRAGEGDHGKPFQEDEQVPHAPDLQQVGLEIFKSFECIFFSVTLAFIWNSLSSPDCFWMHSFYAPPRAYMWTTTLQNKEQKPKLQQPRVEQEAAELSLKY